MRLFNKEKDFILRIINLIFVVWIIVTLIIFYNGMINLFVKQPLDSYGVYKEKTCDIKNCTDNNECPIKESDESSSDELACEARYAAYKENMKQSNLRYTRETISPLLSAITVGITLYLLNRKQKKVK